MTDFTFWGELPL